MHHLGSLIKRIDGVLGKGNLDKETFVDLYMQFELYLKRIKNLTGISPDFASYRIEIIQPQTEGELKQVLSIVRNALATLQENYEHELAVAQAGATNNTATANAQATASVQITISQAVEAVDADPGLSDRQKAELRELLAKAKGAAAKGDKGLFARIGSKIIEGVEQAAPSLIAKALEFLASQATGL